MKCPNCGTEVGNAPFCPSCGADTTSDVRRRRALVRNLDSGARRGISVVVLAVAVVCVILVVLSAQASTDEEDVPAEASLVVGGSAYIVFESGFDDGILSAEVDSDGNVVITLDASIASAYDTFQWELREDIGGTSMAITKSEAELIWMAQSAGRWTVTVYCTSESEESAVYTGSFYYREDAVMRYAWTHGSTGLSVSFTVTASQYVSAAAESGPRSVDSAQAAASFINPEGVAADLEARIWSAYSSAFSGSRTSADYASCLLEFVSSCLSKQSDLITHGRSVYWATPAETLYLGVGDSGDLAVLVASLLAAAGFETGAVSLPGEWAVLTGVFEEDSGFVLEVDGVPCLVTSVDSYTDLGEVPGCYAFDGILTYYGAESSYVAAMY